MALSHCPSCDKLLPVQADAARFIAVCPSCRVRLVSPTETRISADPQAPSREQTFKVNHGAKPRLSREVGEWQERDTPVPRVSSLRFAWMALGWACFGFAILLLSWWFAGNSRLVGALALLGFAAIACLVYTAYLSIRGIEQRGIPMPIRWGLGFACCAGLGYCIHLLNSAVVTIDNSLPTAVTLEVDGALEIPVSAKGEKTLRLRKGQHVILIYDGDRRELDRLEVEVDYSGMYVLNVLGAQTYVRGKATYGGLVWYGSREETLVNEKWIKADVDYPLSGAPSSVSTNTPGAGGPKGVTKTYLARKPPLASQR